VLLQQLFTPVKIINTCPLLQQPPTNSLMTVRLPITTKPSHHLLLLLTSVSPTSDHYYRPHCAQRKSPVFTERLILRFFAPQGRHVAPMGMKFGLPNFTPIGATTRV